MLAMHACEAIVLAIVNIPIGRCSTSIKRYACHIGFPIRC